MLVYGFVGGVGYGFMYLPAVVMVGYYFESKRSLATGISVCGSGVGKCKKNKRKWHARKLYRLFCNNAIV